MNFNDYINELTIELLGEGVSLKRSSMSNKEWKKYEQEELDDYSKNRISGNDSEDTTQKISIDNLLENSGIRVLNATHTDLDGCVSAIVVANVYENTTVVRINYNNTTQFNKELQNGDFDIVIFTDFCPDNDITKYLDAIEMPFLVLDHHASSFSKCDMNREYGKFVFDMKKCGAKLAYDFFSDYAYLGKLERLVEITNDHDLWIRKILPISDQMNTLFFEYGFQRFFDEFFNGFRAFNQEQMECLNQYVERMEMAFKNNRMHLLPHNGIMVYLKRDKNNQIYLSDIGIKLENRFDWVVFVFPSKPVYDFDPNGQRTTKLSIRSRTPNLDVGKTLSEMNIGGGHKGAGGTKDIRIDQIQTVVGKFIETAFPDAK